MGCFGWGPKKSMLKKFMCFFGPLTSQKMKSAYNLQKKKIGMAYLMQTA